MNTVNCRKLSAEGITLAKKLVSPAPRYGKQISLPFGLNFNELLAELDEKALGKRKIEFFEIVLGNKTVGFCYYAVYDRRKSAEIAAIFVPDYRSCGFSQPIIGFLKEHISKYYPELIRI